MNEEGAQKMAKLLIVDDHALFRLGVCTALKLGEEPHEVVGDVGTAHECMAYLASNAPKPDILLLDIILPDESGEEIARKVRTLYPQINILILSAETSEEVLLNLVETGIQGFISKESVQDELYTAIDAIMQGEQYFGKDIDSLLTSLMSEAHCNERLRAKSIFSERELVVIELCSEGYPTKIISDKMGISPRTVDAHKANIFAKLGVTNTVEMVRYAIKHRLVKL